MAMASWRHPQPRHFQQQSGITQNGEYDEIIYDYNTNSYKTRSQQIEILKLREELKEKEKQKKADLKNIIGYYYKR